MSPPREGDNNTDTDDYEYGDEDFSGLEDALEDTSSEPGELGGDNGGIWESDSQAGGDTPESTSESPTEHAEIEAEPQSEREIDTTRRNPPNEISVRQDDGEVRDAQEPPQTGNKFIDAIYQRSWPGKARFERDETPILYTNPLYSAYLHRYFAGVFVFIVGLFFSGHYLSGKTNAFLSSNLPFGIETSVGMEWLLVCLGVFLLGVGIVLITYIRRLYTWFIVTNQRTWVREGILTQVDRGSLNHENVNNVEEKNPAKLRLFGVGHVYLFTASTDDVELQMSHMEDPSTWAQTIRNQKQSKIREQNQRVNSEEMDDDV
jgi:uncharacterized membrane protein